MAAHTQRHLLFLLVPVNTVALAVGLSVAQGAVALPAPPAPFAAAPPPVGALLPAPLTPGQRPDGPRPPTAEPTPAVSAGPPAAVAATAPRATRSAPQRVRRPARSFEADLRRQVARIPLYQPGLARWVVMRDLAVYGATRLKTSTIYLSPRIPRKLLYSVVVHEWGHVISTHAYGGDLRASQQAFQGWFGGGSMSVATERAADCIARLLGATWTHYTGCRSEHWQLGALYLANGMKLPDR